MALPPTPNFGLPQFDDSDTSALDVLLNGVTSTLDTTLQAKLESFGLRKGTTTQRNAFEATKGDYWSDTTDDLLYRYNGTAWVAIPPAPFRMAAGTDSVTASFVTVAFPAGRFTQPPIVVAQLLSGAGGDIGATVMVTGITASTFTARHTSSAGGSRSILWHAIQMTPTSAAG